MIHRPDRLVEIISIMRKYKLEPKIIRFIFSNINKESKMVLVKGVKDANEYMIVEKPLIIYNEKGEYTDEILEIYNKEKK